jgi:hypothetical protein
MSIKNIFLKAFSTNKRQKVYVTNQRALSLLSLNANLDPGHPRKISCLFLILLKVPLRSTLDVLQLMLMDPPQHYVLLSQARRTKTILK